MAHPTYDPYYIHNHRQPPPPEYYYHPISAVETTAHTYPPQIPTNNININIKIPKEKRHINTLFVSGLPHNVIPREIHNLFRRRPGFDSSQLKFTGYRNQVVAFVTFLNHESAVLALQALDGTPFDPQDGSILHVELARSNSRRKRKSGSGPYTVIDKRRKVVDDAEEMSSEDGDNESNASGPNGDPEISNDDKDSAEKSNVKKADLNNPEAAENVDKPTEKPSGDELQPCSTLFIANLGTKYSEDELRETFSKYPGFTELKLRANRGLPVAFADYEEVEQATNAMEALKDNTLPSSDTSGIVIEYARSKMRKS